MAGAWTKHWKRYAAITAVSVALIIGLVLEADPSELASQLSDVDLTLMAVVVALFLFSIALRAFRWYVLLLASDYRVRMRNAFIQYSVAQAINDLTPIKVLGEGVRIWGMKKEEGVPIGTGLATVFGEKIMDLVLVSVVLIASVILLYPDLDQGEWSWLTLIVLLVVAANIAVIVVLLHPDIIEKIGHIGVRFLKLIKLRDYASNIDDSIHRIAMSFDRALDASRGSNRGLTAAAAVLTVPIWIMEFARIAFIMAALGAFAPIPAVVVASTLAMTAQVFLPAGSGNIAVITDVFAAMGIALATATAAGLLSVATSIWISVPVAIIALLLSGRRFKVEGMEEVDLI